MKYFLTEKFTIVPQAFFNESNYKHSLDLLFDIKADESIKNIHIDSLNAKLIYKEEINNYIPFIKYMVDYNSSITDYNKVIFHYCQNNRIFHLVIAKGDKLEIANTF